MSNVTLPQPQPVPYDEKLAAFDSVPLFMRSLPEDTDDPAIGALQSLAHEGTPDEVAQNFKEQGNDYFKGRRFREALGFYTQGVDARPTDRPLLEALLCNRAACNLELKNYGSVLRDCSKALTINPQSSKAYYRSALALVALERYEEAIDCCDRCLAFDSQNASVKSVRERAVKLKEAKDAKERAKQERLAKEQEEKRKLEKAFKERNLIVVKNTSGTSDQAPSVPHFDKEDPSTLVLPVFFLYPQHAQSDFISFFHEDTAFYQHLSIIFPPKGEQPPWDRAGQYRADNLVVYAMTHRKRLLKVGKNMTLADVCAASKAKDGQAVDGLELKDGCLTFAVLPKGEEEKAWVEEYKRNRDS